MTSARRGMTFMSLSCTSMTTSAAFSVVNRQSDIVYLEHFQEFFFAQRLHTKLVCLVEFGAGVFADDEEVSFFADAVGDDGAGFAERLFGFIAGEFAQRPCDDNSFAGERAGRNNFRRRLLFHLHALGT